MLLHPIELLCSLRWTELHNYININYPVLLAPYQSCTHTEVPRRVFHTFPIDLTLHPGSGVPWRTIKNWPRIREEGDSRWMQEWIWSCWAWTASLGGNICLVSHLSWVSWHPGGECHIFWGEEEFSDLRKVSRIRNSFFRHPHCSCGFLRLGPLQVDNSPAPKSWVLVK